MRREHKDEEEVESTKAKHEDSARRQRKYKSVIGALRIRIIK